MVNFLMALSLFDKYVIVINVIGFLAYLINMFLYNHTENGQIDIVLTIVSTVGGSAGVLLAILLFDRKAVKDNMMSRVFVACMFVIQLVIFLLAKLDLLGIEIPAFNGITDAVVSIASSIRDFFARNWLLWVYLGIINFVTFAAFAIDKVHAYENKSRIRIVTLLGLAFIGGSVGALLAMYLLRHKTLKDYFYVGVPLIIIAHMFLFYFLIRIKVL